MAMSGSSTRYMLDVAASAQLEPEDELQRRERGDLLEEVA